MDKPLPANRSVFIARLHAWYRRHCRDLPWRREPSLYKTVVSEFMLQQTQVATALPYFQRWLERFPDFATLAAAAEAEVLKHWEGLGYYSRARNLHRLARALSACSSIPRDVEAWLAFPGVGPYTAAAITSIGFNAKAAVVDGNVVRILTRLTAEEHCFRDSSAAAKALTPLARDLLDDRQPGDHNQAMMELGATVCLRRKPLCTVCPVLAFCVTGRRGDPGAFPKREQRKPVTRLAVIRLWVDRGDALLLHRLPVMARRLAELYELPKAEDLGIESPLGQAIAVKQRAISNERIQETIYRSEATKVLVESVAALADLHWVPWRDLDRVALSGPHRKWIGELRSQEGSS